MNLLSPRSTAVEVLESVAPDREVRDACLGLKAAGYLIALDDFVPGDARESLAEIADIIKVDLIATPRDQWRAMVETHASERTRVLAEKVETPEEFRIARDAGFVLFQGYFFQKPVVFSAQEIPASQMNYLRVLQAIHQPELDWKVIETLIKQEASLCYRLLRYLNSARFAFCSEIRSVRHALSMLGETEIRRWVSMVATLAAARNKPDELVQSALVRARFCEVMAQRIRHIKTDCFLVGLLSLMDTILGISMRELLERIAVDSEIKAALLGESTRPGQVLELACAQENADWTNCTALAAKLRMSEEEVSDIYLQSMRWAREVLRS
jgi:EAL and modified HD-GYP domain-containing signal transduction protein